MGFREDRPRSSGSARSRALRPRLVALEERMAPAIDLATVATAPLGVLNSGLNSSGGAGFSVAEVGDVNGDGFDDYLIGSPGIIVTNGTFNLNAGTGAGAYLVFGSRQVGTPPNVDFLTLTGQQRIGDLGTLGNTTQTNPLNGSPGFAFDGLRFITGQNGASGLGTSVASVGDVNGDGLPDFMMGAPGANDLNGANPGTGRAYLVYGSPNLVRATKTVDLDNPQANTDLAIVTFGGLTPGASIGRAVAGVGGVVTGAGPQVAIGAPGASIGGLASNGAVYLLTGVGNSALVPAVTHTVDVGTVGQPGGVAGITFGGANSGDQAGTSISTAGNFDGTRFGNLPIIDLLIGAPTTGTGAGAAYLVYGSPTLANLQTNFGNNLFGILLSNVGTTVPGAVFTGTAAGDQTGFAVGFAGDFNGDGLSDILVGSPGFNANAGRANLIFGRGAGANNANRINGTFALDGLQAAGLDSVEFDGQAAGSLAGYSLAAVGRINADTRPVNEIAIGAPGNNGGQGAVFLIPGNPDLTGKVTLSVAGIENPTVAGQTITSSVPTTQNFVGTSVSSTLITNGAGRTVDGDSLPDLIIGAAGFSLTSGRINAGAGFVLESAFFRLGVPVSTAITTTIGVGTATPPFVVNATTPNALQIFVFSNATVDFEPVRDINPATIVVNGVPFPNATVTADPVDENNDGIQDAIVTITPRSALNLTTATTSLTITGRILPTSPLANRRFTGTATIQVTGGGGGGGGGGGLAGAIATAPFVGFGGFSAAAPPFGERLVPQPQVLSKLYYKPLPIAVAYRQFLPHQGFGARLEQFLHPQSQSTPRGAADRNDINGRRTSTLGRKVFTSSKFKAGKKIPPIHHGKNGGLNSIPPTLP
jgi:hypothetical protein